MTNRRRRSLPGAAIAAACVLSVAGCGPKLDLHAGIQTELTSLLIGPAPAAPQLPAVVGPVVVPTYAGVPAAAPQAPVPTPTAPPPPPCPLLGRGSFPPAAATSSITDAPRVGRFVFRQTGHSTVDGKAAGKLAGNVVVPVTAKTPSSAQTAAFAMTTPSFEGATITTTFAVQPAPASVPLPPTAVTPPVTVEPPAGLFITKIVTTAGNSTTTFAPTPPGVQVFSQPAGKGTTWQGTATDPTAAVSVTVQGAVTGNTHVNACGNAVDAMRVTLDETVVGTDENLSESHVLAIGSEYGGLILSDKRTVTGSVSGHQIDQTSSLTINSITPIPSRGHS